MQLNHLADATLAKLMTIGNPIPHLSPATACSTKTKSFFKSLWTVTVNRLNEMHNCTMHMYVLSTLKNVEIMYFKKQKLY